jgi:SNF2 family DNA or RNA helicase
LTNSGLLQDDELIQELKKLDGAMIFDEAHSSGQGLKNPNSIHHIIVKEMLEDRKYAFGMTATPMTAGPVDLFHLSNLFHPGSAGESLAKFENRMIKYKSKIDPETGVVRQIPVDRDRKELQEAKEAIKPYVFFQRKSSKLVVDEMEAKGMKLPKMNPVSHPLKLDGEALSLYNAIDNLDFDQKYEPYGGFPEDYLTDLELTSKFGDSRILGAIRRARNFSRKQKCAISPRLVNKDYVGPEPKIDKTIEIVKQHFAIPENHDKPIVIFSSFMNSLDLMKESLVKNGVPEHLIGRITGDVPQKERNTTQDAINAGKLKIVLIGIKAGGAGLNLQKQAYRDVFLDKPWIPSDMEQAVGRTWRTGSSADTVHVHHMKVIGTTDERKYERMAARVELMDNLAFADMDDDYLADTVNASIKRLTGSFDEDVTEWTPEQEKTMLNLAGLRSDDVPPLPTIPAMRENFDYQKFGDSVKNALWKKTGDYKIDELNTMNELKYKKKLISKKQYMSKKKTISGIAKNWLEQTNNSMNHPVARFVGEDFDYREPGTSTIAGGRGGRGKDIPSKQPSMKGVPKKVSKREEIAAIPIKPSIPKFEAHTPIKLKKIDENPYSMDDIKGSFWEAFRRTRPTSKDDAISKVANWMYDYYKDDEDPMTKKEALRLTKKYIDTKNIMKQFAKDGLIEVADVK